MLLSYIEGQKNENLTTSFLAYLFDLCLEENETAVLKGIKEYFRIRGNSYTVEEQKAISNGYIDLLIEDAQEQSILIENKFYAGFTYSVDGQHQLVRYASYLEKECTSKVKRLVVLTVKRREAEVRDVIRALISGKFEIVTEIVFWDELIKILRLPTHSEKYKLAFEELAEYVDKKYVNAINLSSREIKMIFDKECATGYNKMMNIISSVHNYLVQNINDVERINFDKEELWYGFEFQHSGAYFFFGNWPDYWSETGKPLVLQVMKHDNINIDDQDKELITVYKNRGFKKSGKLFGLCYEIEESDIENDDKIINKIKEVLNLA